MQDFFVFGKASPEDIQTVSDLYGKIFPTITVDEDDTMTGIYEE